MEISKGVDRSSLEIDADSQPGMVNAEYREHTIMTQIEFSQCLILVNPMIEIHEKCNQLT